VAIQKNSLNNQTKEKFFEFGFWFFLVCFVSRKKRSFLAMTAKEKIPVQQ